MKDYTLSEIKEKCKRQKPSCSDCDVKDLCYHGLDCLDEVDIEPRDRVIESHTSERFEERSTEREAKSNDFVTFHDKHNKRFVIRRSSVLNAYEQVDGYGDSFVEICYLSGNGEVWRFISSDDVDYVCARLRAAE